MAVTCLSPRRLTRYGSRTAADAALNIPGKTEAVRLRPKRAKQASFNGIEYYISARTLTDIFSELKNFVTDFSIKSIRKLLDALFDTPKFLQDFAKNLSSRCSEIIVRASCG
ncbi:MAG: hypothetical protein O9322_13435 [Beijerinckiaceae bacterium]|nr:hypothetical protein [Beijerinckiaceae bacterium]MCZ8300347.1 hypothetical protein [Beijerinckiaceae bacterium]